MINVYVNNTKTFTLSILNPGKVTGDGLFQIVTRYSLNVTIPHPSLHLHLIQQRIPFA